MEAVKSLLESATFGNVLNIAGIVLTLIGFWVTISSAWKAQSAAELAQREVAKVRNDFRKVDTIQNAAYAIKLMDEIKGLHRDEKWIILVDRYAVLKSLLITIRSNYSDFSDDEIATIQSTITELTTMQKQAEKVLVSQKSPDVVRLNTIMTTHTDNLKELLERIRNGIGG